MGKKIIQLRREGALPREVYFQCIWIVKDLDRMKQISARDSRKKRADDEVVLYLDDMDSILSVPVIKAANHKLECIRQALQEIPEEYRELIIDNIRGQASICDTAHSNTINKWKQRFIYSLAKNLRLC